MKDQTYKNHRMFYPPHHFIYLPLLCILLVWSIWKAFKDDENQLIWTLFSVTVFLLLYLAVMVRQHYALGNQNRIVIAEFRQRYFELHNKTAEGLMDHLTFSQISALRFAYDEEFKTLLNRAITERISGDEIKRSITKWRPDHNRV